ncbi:hypothetical protein [Streptosporangium sandarakinum]|uniref:hypothetical protein n=1 Tax=Streptosporangium sandarakinum TaxID=1260955 RepID=UPI0036C9224B
MLEVRPLRTVPRCFEDEAAYLLHIPTDEDTLHERINRRGEPSEQLQIHRLEIGHDSSIARGAELLAVDVARALVIAGLTGYELQFQDEKGSLCKAIDVLQNYEIARG